jgi:hypothetical protein
MTELFRNSTEALVFAFRFSHQQYALSPMAKMAKTGIVGAGKGLVALDGAGQAGMIRREVDALPVLKRLCIVARYSVKFEECGCCGGDKMIAEYREAITNLADWSLQHLTGMSLLKMRQYYVRAFYERLSIKEMADQLRVEKSLAYRQKDAIWTALKKLDAEAQREICDRLDHMLGFGSDESPQGAMKFA